MKKLVVITILIGTFMLSGMSTVYSIDGNRIIQNMDEIMYPNSRSEFTLTFKESDGTVENYKLTSYARDKNQSIIVRFFAPARVVGNDLIMLEQNVWMYDKRSDRISKIPSNQSFGGTGFSYGDIVRLNLQDNYDAVIVEENERMWKLELTAKDRNAPYFRIEYEILKEGHIPVKGICYGKNNKVIKTIEYSEVKEFNGVKKPAKLTVISPVSPDNVSIMVLDSETVKTYPKQIFNKRNLAARMEESL